jgi:hypothetical protein
MVRVGQSTAVRRWAVSTAILDIRPARQCLDGSDQHRRHDLLVIVATNAGEDFVYYGAVGTGSSQSWSVYFAQNREQTVTGVRVRPHVPSWVQPHVLRCRRVESCLS